MLAQLVFLAITASAFARPPQSEAIGVSETIAHDLCPADLWHFLLPHEYDCTKFYYCEFGEKWVTPRDCALGTHFSFELQVCVHPVQAGCTLPGVPTEAPETEAPETEAPETEAPETEAPETEATTSAPSSTIASIISSPHTTEAPETEATTSAPSSTIASIISSPHTTEAPETEATTSAPSSTIASMISSPHTTEAPETEAPETEATTSAPSSTEAAIISTTAAPSSTETEATDAPTTASPGWLDNGCPDSWDKHWLLPHEECNKFYYCNFGEKVERVCPSNTYFNPDLQVCDHPWNVECANGSEDNGTDEEDSDGEWLENGCPADWDVHWLLPHESDCGKFYYCVHGQTVERECPTPLHFNPTLQVCDWAENAGCSSGDNNGEDGNGTEEDGNGGEEDSGNGGSTEEGGGEWLENGCPADWDVHWLLPHETDCGKFYYCVHGQTVERECPTPLHFNPTLQVCDWAENAGCSSGDNNGEDGNGTEEDGNGGEEDSGNGGSTEEGGGEWLENGCPADWDVHWLLPHETDCGKFYYCVHGQTVERECPTPLHFNPTLQVCDWAENAGCSSGDNNGEDGNGTEEDGNGGEEDSGNGGNTEEGGGEWLENGCPADWDVHWLLPHETDCGKFYYCVHGQTVERECPTPLHFNHILQVCDWAENAGCNSAGNSEEDGNNGGNTEEEGGEWLDNGCPADWDVHWLLPHETDCGKFYYCVHGQTVERECPTPLHFNPTLQVCDWVENAGCSSGDNNGEDGNGTEEDGNGGEEDSGNGGSTEEGGGEWLENGCPADWDVHWLLPHETDCGKFYYCVHGQTVERECPTPLHFNPTLQVCDWAEDAGCASGGNSETNSEEDNTIVPEEEEPDHSKCTSSCNILPWAHESACDKYWRCDGEKAVLVVCSEGLHFNAISGSCDFICNANCVREAVQTTADQQGLKIFVPWNKVRKGMRYY